MSNITPLLTTSYYGDEDQTARQANLEMENMLNDIQKHLALKFNLGELLNCSAFSPDGRYLCFTTDNDFLYVIPNIEEQFAVSEIARNGPTARITSSRSFGVIQRQQITPIQLKKKVTIIKIKHDPNIGAYIIGCFGNDSLTLFELRDGCLNNIYEKENRVSNPALEITDDMAIIHNTSTDVQVITYTNANDSYEFSEECAYNVTDSTVISSFKNVIVSGNFTGHIHVHRLMPNNDTALMIKCSNSWISAICYYKTYIIAGDSSGSVYMYNDYEAGPTQLKSFKAHDDVVRFIIGNPFSNYFLTASRDVTVKLWKIHKDTLKETYLHNSTSKGIEKHFKAIIFTPFGLTSEIYIASRSGKVLRYLSPEYIDSESCLAEHTEEIHHLCSYGSDLISCAKGHEIQKLENIEEVCGNYSFTSVSTNLRKKGIIATDVPEKSMSISPDGKQLLYYAEGELIKTDLSTATNEGIYIEDPVVSMITYEENQVFYVFTGHRGHWIRQWKIDDLSAPISQTKVHTSQVRSLALADFEDKSKINPKIKILFSGGKYSLIGYRTDQPENQTKVKAHSKYINDLKVTKDSSLLISCSDDCLIIIWNIHFSFLHNELSVAKLKEISYHSQRVTSLLINDNHFMASSFDGTISIWNISDFSLCLKLEFDEPCSSVVSLKKNSILAVAAGKRIIALDNPVSTEKFLIFGERSKIRKFIKYIYSAYSSSPPEHDIEMDSFFIAKYHMNILHVYADRDLAEHLTLSLRAGGPFSTTKENETPLSLSLKSKHRDCINAILDNINKRIIESPKTASYLEEKLDILNEIGASSLDEFYNSIFIKREYEVEKFVIKYNKLPKIINSETFVPLKRNFEEPDKFIFGRNGVSIVFYTSAVQANMTCGSWESIKFLTSLKNCPNNNIFTTTFIQTLLLDKWFRLRPMIWAQTFIYFTYLTLLTLYFTVFNDTWGFLYILSFFNLILFAIEAFHMTVDFSVYKKDKWNCFDVLRDLFMFCYVICKEILEIHYEHLGLLLIIVTVLSWAKGISYFRVHKSTRYIVNLFANVIKDMVSFVIFLFFLDVSFLVIFISIDDYEQTEIQSIGSYFMTIYLLNYGDFNTDSYTTVKWALCFVATLCNTLIMLNLCIAIIGNTFNKVQENLIIADQLEMIDIILECEFLLFTRRNTGIKSYMQMCCAKDSKQGKEGNVDEVLNEIQENVSKAMAQFSERTNQISEVEKDIAELKEMVQVLIRKQQTP